MGRQGTASALTELYQLPLNRIFTVADKEDSGCLNCACMHYPCGVLNESGSVAEELVKQAADAQQESSIKAWQDADGVRILACHLVGRGLLSTDLQAWNSHGPAWQLI